MHVNYMTNEATDHGAACDVISLIKVCSTRSKDFISYVENHRSLFRNVKKMWWDQYLARSISTTVCGTHFLTKPRTCITTIV